MRYRKRKNIERELPFNPFQLPHALLAASEAFPAPSEAITTLSKLSQSQILYFSACRKEKNVFTVVLRSESIRPQRKAADIFCFVSLWHANQNMVFFRTLFIMSFRQQIRWGRCPVGEGIRSVRPYVRMVVRTYVRSYISTKLQSQIHSKQQSSFTNSMQFHAISA